MSTQTIYNAFRAAGMTHAGALAMTGNFAEESNNISCRVQGDFSKGFLMSVSYTSDVDSGVISKHQFVHSGPGGGGYGLAQWTWPPRKERLYDFARQSKKSIGDEQMQVAFAVKELKQDFPSLWQSLCNTDDLHSAVSNVCYLYENPAVKNVEARYKAALDIEASLGAQEPSFAPAESEYWPPRTVDKSMNGPDVEVLRAVLKARGFVVSAGDVFDGAVDDAVRKFQVEKKLTVDGVVGPKTWAELLKI